MIEKTKKNRAFKILKGMGIVIGIIGILIMGSYFYITSHTQILVGMIQDAMYQESKPNSFEPLYTPDEGQKEDGQYKINDIAYGTKYPNSFLDITYPDANREVDRPTLFYFHGGGFFGGSKNMGDPMAVSDSTALIDDLCSQGFNIVNVDYALVPEYRFPVPLIQMNEAIQFMSEHKDEYNINMDKVIIMGSSAGAIMSAQYGTIVSNPEYAKILSIDPAINLNQVLAIVVDDAPIDYQNMELLCKMLIGNYVKGSIYLNKEELDKYECIPYMTKDYPPAFLLESEYRKDMISMVEKLKTEGAYSILVDPFAENGIEQPHCFIASERVDSVAAEAFKKLTDFLKERLY